MRALVLDDEARTEISKVIAYAQDHKINFPSLEKMMAGELYPVGDNAFYACYLNQGYRAVFSFEEQPCGWCRHLSISVDTRFKLPNVPAVELIMKEFGFSGGIYDCTNVWVEDEKAINVLQIIEDKNG
jgi:hypothetical protein